MTKVVNKSTPLADVAVLIGRFQVDDLHEGHISLLKPIIENHSKTIIFLGLSQCKCTTNNPLDYEARKKMILKQFPDVNVLYIADQYSDQAWSSKLDNQIKDLVGPSQTVTLFGSRDSFIKHYTGKYTCEEVEQTVFVSGTDIRKVVGNTVKGSSDFRKGVIWAIKNQYPACLPTVDACIIKSDDDGNVKILLAKRDTEPRYRFVGGFVSPGETYEDAVKREAREETGLELQDPAFVKSYVIDDWRYRSEVNKITSSLFVLEYMFGTPKPNDDVDQLRWFPLNKDLLKDVVDEHLPLMEDVIELFDYEGNDKKQ